jgi:uncharacterized RDD family membrane protein YckC
VSEFPEPGSAERVAPPLVKRPVVYAGFWLRLVAYVIDSFLVGFVAGIVIFLPLLERGAGGISPDNFWALYTSNNRQVVAMRLLAILGAYLYWALLESSAWQATIGKRILSLMVTDLEGRRITLGRASARFFAKFISGFILMIGYVMAGFTEKKQALHDMIAGCLVIRKV